MSFAFRWRDATRPAVRGAGYRPVLGAVLCALALPVSASAQPAHDVAPTEFVEAFRQIRARYAEPVDERTLIENAIRGMVRSLDSHSEYFDATTYDQLRRDTAGVFGGIGVEVAMEEGVLRIVDVFEDTPAFRAGLRAGDSITHLDAAPVAAWTLEQAIGRARGEPGSRIVLTVLRRGQARPATLTLERAIVQSRSVEFARIEAGYGHLGISVFNQRTPHEALAALAAASRGDGVLKGLVLDLRDNPGGSLRAAVAVCSLFLKDAALIVSTESASPQSRMQLFADARRHARAAEPELLAALQEMPVAVLVNEQSASAAEIVAGALQDHGRARVIGTRTFGKGSIQLVLPLVRGAAIKLTAARYRTPGGRLIEGLGIVPDLAVERTSEDDDPQLARAIETLRQSAFAISH